MQLVKLNNNNLWSQLILPIVLVATFLLSLFNFFLLLRLFQNSSPQLLVEAEQITPVPGEDTKGEEDDLALHIERLIVLDYLFGGDRDREKELSPAELLIIERLFEDEK